VADPVVVNTGKVNIRQGPSKEYEVIATATQGTVLTRIDSEGNWDRVSWDGGEGWIARSTITRQYQQTLSKTCKAKERAGQAVGTIGGGVGGWIAKRAACMFGPISCLFVVGVGMAAGTVAGTEAGEASVSCD